MRYWGVTLFVLIACTCAWGQGANQFSFVSALYTPRASFNEIETVSDQTTVFENPAEFWVGTSASKAGGAIHVEGNPIRISTLTMKNDTKLEAADNTKWLLDTLKVGVNGNVTVGSLIANKLFLKNSSTDDTDMKAQKLHVATEDVWTKDGVASSKLEAEWEEPGSTSKFHFAGGSETVPENAEATATWKPLTQTPTEQGKGISVDANVYPIFTN